MEPGEKCGFEGGQLPEFSMRGMKRLEKPIRLQLIKSLASFTDPLNGNKSRKKFLQREEKATSRLLQSKRELGRKKQVNQELKKARRGVKTIKIPIPGGGGGMIITRTLAVP